MDPQHRLIEISDRWLELLGCSRNEAIGRAFTQFTTERWRRMAEAADLLEELRTGVRAHTPCQLVTRSGEPIEVVLHAIVPREAPGRADRWQAVLIERAEPGLQSPGAEFNARQWQETFDAIQDCVVVVDRDFRILQANKAMREAIPDACVVGARCYEVIHGTSAPPSGCPGRTAFELGTAAQVERREPRLGDRWFDFYACPIRDATGEPVQAVHVLHDITGQKLAQEEIAGLARFPGENPYPILRVDRAGKILYSNRPAGHLLRAWGCHRHRVLGGRWRALVLDALNSMEARSAEVECDDQVFALTFAPVADSGYVNVYGLDVTEHKQLEAGLRQSQKMEAIGHLAGGVAHDFNNILASVLGYASMYKLECEPGSGAQRAFTEIERAAERAAKLTRQLLGFARRGKFQVRPVDLDEVVREVVMLLEHTIDKRVRIVLDLASDGYAVMGDPGQLHQVVLNLALNARDAMPDGGRLYIQTEIVGPDDERSPHAPGDGSRRQLMLTVSDTGHGIPADIIEHVFDPFFSTKAAGKGTGMGLATVYGVVKHHGGTVSVHSREGAGAALSVCLPVADRPAGQTGPPADTELVRGKGRILIVDDEEAVRGVASTLLSRLGYSVAAVANGAEAVRYCREHSGTIDLAIIDMIMPRMDGHECYKALKALDPGIRAILSSGYDRDERVQNSLREGMLGFIQKPYTLDKLSQIVARMMGN